MLSYGQDLPQKPLQIKQNDKLLSRILSKETSRPDSSFRVLYYGGASGAIPFTWESRPGTPKHPFSDSSLPPLTPPPSYQFSPKGNSNSAEKDSKPSFLHTIFPNMGSRKKHFSPSFSSSSVSSSSCSSSYSLPSTPLSRFVSRRSSSGGQSRSAFEFEGGDEKGAGVSSPTSTLCYGGVRERDGSWRTLKGRRQMKKVKKVLWSILGHGGI